MGKRGPLRIVKGDLEVAGNTAQTKITTKGVIKTKAVKQDDDLGELWDEVAPQINELGWTTRADSLAVEMLLRHVLAARLASDELFSRGSTAQVDPIKGHEVSHPAGREFRSESKIMLEYAKQLGMTFMSRARTEMPGDGEEDTPFDEAIG